MKRLCIILFALIPFISSADHLSGKYEKVLEKMASDLADDLKVMGIKKVAITTIFDQDGNTNQFTYMLEEDLTVALLNQRKGLEVMDRKHLQEVLKEHKLAAGGLMNEETLVELGKLETVDVVITGSIIKIDSDFRINMKAMSTASGMIVSARKYSLNSNSELRTLYASQMGLSTSISTDDMSKVGSVKFKNRSRRVEIVLFYNNPKNEEQKNYRRTIVLKRGDTMLLEDIPVGNLQYNAFKHRRSSNMLRVMLKPDNPLKMGNVNIDSGTLKKVML